MVGESGVDMFFIISGFVMFLSTHNRDVEPLDFLTARFVRIAPLYYMFTLIFIFLLIIYKELPRDFSYKEVILSFLFIPFYNSINHQPMPVLGVGWTLNYEFLFYIILAVAVTLRAQAGRIAFIGISFIVLIIGRFIVHSDTAIALRFTSPLFLEFFAGYLLAYAYYHFRPSRPTFGVMLMIGGLLLLVLGAYLGKSPRTIVYGIPAFIIVLGAVLSEPIFQSQKSRIIAYLGDASYSTYLSHGLVIYFAEQTVSFISNLVWVSALLIACTLAGILCYETFEKPIIAGFKARKGRSLQRARVVAP